MNSQFFKNMALWTVILLMVLMLMTMLRQNQDTLYEVPYSEFTSHVDSGDVESVTIEDNHISGRMKSSGEFATYAPRITDSLLAELKEKNVQVAARPARESPIWQTVLVYWFPFLLFVGLWLFFLRQMHARGYKARGRDTTPGEAEILDDKELEAIRRRCNAATPGPWKSVVEGRDPVARSRSIMTGRGESRSNDIELIGATVMDQDFIAHSRRDIPRLLDELYRTRK
jgi:hypothetical protein